MPAFIKQPGSRAIVRATANETLIIAGNSSVSNVAAAGEVVATASISRILYSTNGQITISRGANTLLNLFNSGDLDFKHTGFVLNEFPAANLVISFSSSGSVIIELSKSSDMSGTQSL